MNYIKLENVVLYFLEHSKVRVDFLHLSKLIYYTEAYYYQKHHRTFLDTDYIHIGAAPYPMFFYEAIHSMVDREVIRIEPLFDGGKITRFIFASDHQANVKMFTRSERQALRVVGYTFRRGLGKESVEFPNLYKNYVLTDLFHRVDLVRQKIPKKIKLPKKPRYIKRKSFLYRIFFE